MPRLCARPTPTGLAFPGSGSGWSGGGWMGRSCVCAGPCLPERPADACVRRRQPPEPSRSPGSVAPQMMSAFGGLSSPCGSCLLDLPQPWVLKLPLLGLRVLPCTPEGWGRCGGQGGWAQAGMEGREGGRPRCFGGWRRSAHKAPCPAPLAFLSFLPSLLSCSFVHSFSHSFVHSMGTEHELWARQRAGCWEKSGKPKQP